MTDKRAVPGQPAQSVSDGTTTGGTDVTHPTIKSESSSYMPCSTAAGRSGTIEPDADDEMSKGRSAEK